MTHTPMTTFRRVARPAASLACAVALGGAVACSDDPAPLFEPTGTGTVSGILFFDRDNNGAYTPVAGDSALGNVRLDVLDRGTANPLGTATTDAEGRFSVVVPPGTHDLQVVGGDAFAGAGFVFCGARPSVYQSEALFLEVPIKLGCVIRINVAKTRAVDSPITVAGIVTAGQGTFRSNNVYVQDATGGIQVFGLTSAANLQVGDSVEITGVLGAFRTELQVNSPVVAPNVTRGVTPPAPKATTTAALAAQATATSGDVGRLVKVSAAQAGAFGTGTSGISGTIRDASDTDLVLRLDQNVFINGSLTAASFDPAKCYDVTGVLGIFDNVPQLKPRGASDVVEVPCTP